MKLINKNTGLAFFSSLISFVALVAIVLLTNPLQNVSYAIYFFGLLFGLIVSLSYFIRLSWGGRITSNYSYKVFVCSILFIILAMFKSAGSLGIANVAILILLSAGLLFYFNRRS